MTDRTLTVLGAGLAGMVWVGVLTAVLWEPAPDDVRAELQLGELLLGLTAEDRRPVGSLPYPFTIQNLMWIVFFLGFGELMARYRAGGAEGAQLARRLLPEDDLVVLRRNELGPFYKQIRESDPEGTYWLQRLLTSVVLQFQSNGSTDQVNAVFNSLVDLFQHEIELRYNLLRYLVWLIPTLGFIGTVLGIALALAQAGAAFAAAAEPGGGAPSPEMMENVTGELGVAFYTTLLALLQSALLMATMHVVQGREERALNRVGQYCLRNLVNRLYEQR